MPDDARASRPQGPELVVLGPSRAPRGRGPEDVARPEVRPAYDRHSDHEVAFRAVFACPGISDRYHHQGTELIVKPDCPGRASRCCVPWRATHRGGCEAHVHEAAVRRPRRRDPSCPDWSRRRSPSRVERTWPEGERVLDRLAGRTCTTPERRPRDAALELPAGSRQYCAFGSAISGAPDAEGELS